jgi:hypothetical protein
MTRTLRVFVNGRGVDVPSGATALDAVRAFGSAAAEEVACGATIVTDSRGLPAPSDTIVSAGSIFRLVPNRARGESSVDEDPAEAQS